MSVRYFEDLEVWKEARRLTKEVYAATHGQSFVREGRTYHATLRE
ncbi:MAG: hypothetical protein V3W37_10625 [Candidatus Binatia bacterium]